MRAQKGSAFVFVHAFAKKPASKELEEVWQSALIRDDPKGDVFPIQAAAST